MTINIQNYPLSTAMFKETTMKYVYFFLFFILCSTPALAQQSRGAFLDEMNNRLVPKPEKVCRCYQKTSRFSKIETIWTKNDTLHNKSNEHSLVTVRVEADHPDKVYAKDDLLRVTVESGEDGYLYLFYRDAAGNVIMLFPNRFQKKNFVQKNEPVTVPSPNSIFQIRIDAPFGNELLKAVVSQKPLEFFADLDLTGINALPIAEEDGKTLAKSVMAMKPSDWAEHHVVIRTVDSRDDSEDLTIAAVPEQSLKGKPKKLFSCRMIFRAKKPCH